MLELIKDLPPFVVGIRAPGEVTAEEYRNTVLPVADAAVKEHGDINYLLVMETDISNWNLSALEPMYG